MRMNSTELRRSLFKVLERVVAGDTVEIAYKGSCVRLSPCGATSKLARAKRQNTLLCDPDSIVHSDERLTAKMRAEWRKDWKKL
jgi:antitoxin (DNA-binding transcriptional repressor) of toxin-antitoxin stability system